MKNTKILFIITTLIITSISYSDGSADIKKKNSRIDQINKEVNINNSNINKNNTKITTAKKTEQQIKIEITKLNNLIKKLESDYKITQSKYIKLLKDIGKNDTEIRKSINEINQSSQEIVVNSVDYSNKIKVWDKTIKLEKIYTTNNENTVENLKKSHDIKIILDQQRKDIQKIEQHKNNVEIKKSNIEQIKSNNQKEANKVNEVKKELEKNRKDLKNAKANKDKSVKELENLQKTLSKQNQNYKARNNALIAERKKLEAQIKAIIEAAIKDKNAAAAKNVVDKVTNNKPSVALPTKVGTGQLSMPIAGKIVLGYGQEKVAGLKSNGIEILGKLGSSVKAADGGTVIFSGSLGNLESVIIIDHGSLISVYGNLSTVKVAKGKNVNKGDVIGTLGRDTTTKEARLYFETRKGVKIVDPRDYL